MELFPPRCSKRNLLAIAGLLWIIAGAMVTKLGLEVVFNYKNSIIVSLVVAVLVFYIFFNFIFKKLVTKHKIRIQNKENEKLCLFSFFDFKSYLIMAFMMTLGISIRSMEFINPIYWAPVYIGIGSALFLAGVFFIIEWKKWN